MAFEIPNNANGETWFGSDIQYIEDEFNLVNTNGKLALAIPPIGAILPWAKTITGVPALPSGYVECDGSVLSDAGSPMNGETMPNLNGSTEATKKFLRGATTSGGTGGTIGHTHTQETNTGQLADAGGNLAEWKDHDHGEVDVVPPFYEVVFIIRVK